VSGRTTTPPPWWSALQDDFGRFLRAPLIAADGHFRSGPPDPALLARVVDDAAGAGPGARARLALYHEQYWMRLFHTPQQAFPRTARVTGFFAFNRLASAHLQACPPRGRDLADVGRDFYRPCTPRSRACCRRGRGRGPRTASSTSTCLG